MSETPESPQLLRPLGDWFETRRRDLPWRARDLDRTHPDPYAVLVSEFMLQQTQVATVIPYFERWMARFPTLGDLATAPESDVFGLWSGLGYYQRAPHLHQAARILDQEGWPGDLDGLRRLPGLGPYAAAALASIAFQWPEPALDGNAFRVLARILGMEEDPRRKRNHLETWLRPALAELGPSRITQALMELGATHCGRIPDCAACPIAQDCTARRLGKAAQIPPVQPRPEPKRIALWLLAIHAEGAWLMIPPRRKGLLAGLWAWPTLPHPDDIGMPITQSWDGWTQVYTHRREAVHPLRLAWDSAPEVPGCAWVPEAEFAELPLGRRDQRLRDLLGTPMKQGTVGLPAPAALRAALSAGAGLPG